MPRSALSKDVDRLLKPAFKRLKSDAISAIRATQDEMKGVLKVLYDAPEEVCRPALPVPRLQLRWEDTGYAGSHVCHYEMVFPLPEHDIRNEAGTNHAVVQLGRTTINGPARDWDTCDLTQATPFRDGVHCGVDAAVFGGMQAYVVAPNGRSARIVQNENATARGRALIRSDPA